MQFIAQSTDDAMVGMANGLCQTFQDGETHDSKFEPETLWYFNKSSQCTESSNI